VLRGVLIVGSLAIALLALALVLPGGSGHGPAQAALAAHVAGVAPEDQAYPRQGEVLRQRAWLIAAPGQDDGVDLFAALPDAVFRRERVIVPADLRTALARIRGLAWDGATQAWSGNGRTVPLAEVRRLLEAALPTPTDATVVLDLLLGRPAPGVPALAGLLLAEPPTLQAIHLVPFHGDAGQLLLDRGRPPYGTAERGYDGMLASFTGVGWPPGWRVIRLRALEQ